MLSAADLKLIVSVSGQLAAAVVHGQLFAAERQQRTELATIYATILEINARRDPDSLLRTLTERACLLVQADGGLLSLYDEATDELEVVVVRDVPALPVGSRVRMGEGVVGQAAAEQRTVCVNAYQDWPSRLQQGLPAYEMIAAAPLLVAGRVVGVLGLGRQRVDRPFTSADTRLIELFAAQAAQAIETAQLLEHERQRRHELEVLHEVSRAITGQLNVEHLMQTVVNKAATIFAVPAVLLLILDEASALLQPVAWVGLAPTLAAAYTLSPDALERLQFPTHSLWPTHEALEPAEVAEPAALVPALSTPILLGTRLIGALLLFTDSAPRHFSAVEQRLAGALVQQVTQAVENARLYERERMLRADAEQSVNELTAVLGELERAHDNLGRIEKLRMLGELASGVAHDFNNVLAGVLAHTQLLLLDEDNPSKQEWLQQIEVAALEGKAMVRRIQEFARPQQSAKLEELDINVVIMGALEMTGSRWRDKRRDSRTSILPVTRLESAQTVTGNATDLRRVFVNLILNAVDAMPEGGTLQFISLDHDDQLQIEVVDTGTGMSAEVQAKVFEPFYTTKAVGVGTGLGLSICEQIVTRHGGSITVESTVGVGTKFTLRLPATKQH